MTMTFNPVAVIERPGDCRKTHSAVAALVTLKRCRRLGVFQGGSGCMAVVVDGLWRTNSSDEYECHSPCTGNNLNNKPTVYK